MSASEIIACIIGGCLLAFAVLAWSEPEPKSPPDSILASDYVTTLGAKP